VFSVGLQSRSFDPETLQRVAAGGAGEYLGAASADGLAGVYRQLGGQLANAYFVRYRSLARSGAKVTTEVDAAGHRTVADYRAPRLALAPVALGEERAPIEHDSFLASATGTTVIAIAVLVLAFVSVLTLTSHFRRKAELRGRISAYGLPLPDEPDLPGSHDEATRDGMSERWAFGEKRWAALGASLELARVGITPARFVALVALATLVLAWVATLLAGSAFAAILMLGLTPFMARTYVGWKLGKERRAFADQLADSMQAVASAMRTGNSFVGAIAILVEDAPEPTATEFRRVIADERLGVPLEEAFGRVVQRMDNRDLEQVALVSILQRETGGNGAEALDRVVGNLRARADIRRLLRTLTSQGRMAQWVLTALPVVTVVLMTLLGGEQMQLLYTTVIGQVALVVAALLVIGGGGWIRKIVNIRV
jgi:tight adherence protein B